MRSWKKYPLLPLWKQPPMETKPVLSRSSNLVTVPALAIMLILSVLAAFFPSGEAGFRADVSLFAGLGFPRVGSAGAAPYFRVGGQP